MGGMGFIQSNHSRILFNSTMISFNVRAAPDPSPGPNPNPNPHPNPRATPEQDAYGLEKLMTEELLMHYDADFGMEAR